MNPLLPLVTVTLLWTPNLIADQNQKLIRDRDPSPMAIADLVPTMDRKDVTLQFTVKALDGIAGSTKPGQAASFAIDTKTEHDKKRLGVWIEGELVNVLDRLQMGAWQTNHLKPGTIIVATGTLRIHQDRKRQESYTLHVNKWQQFRIVTADETE